MTTTTSLELQKQKALYKKTIKIFGPPGTGKTHNLIERVLKGALRRNINPNNIAFISFTNKAVNTARDRALSAFPKYTVKDFNRFKTLHSYCRRYFQEEVFDTKDCMLDFALQNKIIRTSDNRVDDDNFTYKDWSLAIYDKARNMMEDPVKVYKKETYKKEQLNVFLRKIDTYEHYKRSGGENSFIDFTDMIGRAIDEIEFPPLDILILDEAQDFTPLQWSVIYKMCDNVKRIYLAGDDDQAIYRWNGADPKYFTTYFPGRKVVLRKTQRFGEAVYNFAQIIRRGIVDSEDKLYTHNNSKNNYVKRYLSFREVPFNELNGTWYVLGRIHTTVNELRASAKDAGLYYKDNKGNKSFDERQWEAIKAWTALNNGRKIGKKTAENLYKYIREIKDSDYRTQKFWLNIPDYQEFDFNDLREWAGLDMTDEYQKKAWWWVLKRNFSPRQTIYFIRLLKRYGQEALNNEPNILIDTIHSVKGGEANNVLIYSKANWLSDFNNKSKSEKSDESRVYYTGVTRAKDTIHLLSTDYKYNYPIGKDYLVYLKENDK